MDYEVQRCTRQCAKTQRQLEPGETFFSVLTVDGAEVVRHDFSAEAWEGPPEGALGWWKSEMPTRDGKRMNLAPNEVMLELFEEMEKQPELADMRYVLTLLLIRRRVMRLEESEHDEADAEMLHVYCPRKETSWDVPVATPTAARAAEIQDELAKLLFADAA